MQQTLTLVRPDDWHLHLRDGAALATVVPHSARQFARALVMPNLAPPVVRTEQALAYRARILNAVPEGIPFNPLMTLYLTDNTAPGEITRARESGHVVACKLYPAGATTNSDHGVTDIRRIHGVLAEMEKRGMVLCVHGEVTGPDVDIFDRESVFVDQVLTPLAREFPGLRIVLEHITTKGAADFVAAASALIAATITPQHLLYNRNEIFRGGIRPHNYCLPILKRESHRLALVAAATGGNPKYFLGSDSAPHARHTKEADCGCAGCYSGFHALELYAEVFARAGALDRLEGFASFHGADFYGLPRNTDKVVLKREPLEVPGSFPFGDHELVPLSAGETLDWKLVRPR